MGTPFIQDLAFLKQLLKDNVASCVLELDSNSDCVQEAHAAAHAKFARVPLLEHCIKDELFTALHNQVRALVRKAKRAGWWSASSLVSAKQDVLAWNAIALDVFNAMAQNTDAVGMTTMAESPLSPCDPMFMRFLDRQWMQLCEVALDISLHPISSPLTSLTTLHVLHLMSPTTAIVHVISDVLFSCIAAAVVRLTPDVLPLSSDVFLRFGSCFYDILSLKCRDMFDQVPYWNPFGTKITKEAAVSLFADVFHLSTDTVYVAISKLEWSDMFLQWPISVSELYVSLEASTVIVNAVPKAHYHEKHLAVQRTVQKRNTVLRALQLAFQDDRGISLQSFPTLGARGSGWHDYVSFVVFKCFQDVYVMLQHKCATKHSLRESNRRQLLHKIRDRVLHNLACLGYTLGLFKQDSAETDVLDELDALAKRIADDMVIKDAFRDGYIFSLHPLVRVLSNRDCIGKLLTRRKKSVVCTCHGSSGENLDGLHQRVSQLFMPWKECLDTGCCHSAEPLCVEFADDTADHVCFAFGASTPQMLMAELGGDKWDHVLCVSMACIWNMSYVARRTLKSMHAMTPLGDYVLATCVSCLEESLPNWSLCTDHPVCLQCMLAHVEGVFVDALSFRKAGDKTQLFRCSFPDCSVLAASLDRLLPWLPPEMMACYQASVQRQQEHACAMCLCVLSDTEDGVVAHCSACELTTCLQCGRSSHPGTVCSAAFRREFGTTVEDILSDASKQTCPKCLRAVMKDAGCNHMTCVCGQHWCWQCGADVDSRNPSLHFRDAVGGTLTSACSQFMVQDEASRIRKRIMDMDVVTELRQQALLTLDQTLGK